jgi:hypothetical protein
MPDDIWSTMKSAFSDRFFSQASLMTGGQLKLSETWYDPSTDVGSISLAYDYAKFLYNIPTPTTVERQKQARCIRF